MEIEFKDTTLTVVIRCAHLDVDNLSIDKALAVDTVVWNPSRAVVGIVDLGNNFTQ